MHGVGVGVGGVRQQGANFPEFAAPSPHTGKGACPPDPDFPSRGLHSPAKRLRPLSSLKQPGLHVPPTALG